MTILQENVQTITVTFADDHYKCTGKENMKNSLQKRIAQRWLNGK